MGTPEATVLAHVVDDNGIKHYEKHAKAIIDLKEPTKGAELLRFFGLMNFFPEFVEDFGNRAKPLYSILQRYGFNKKNSKRKPVVIPDFEQKWGPEHAKARADLKMDMCNPRTVTCRRRDSRKWVLSDASSYGLGAVLLQEEGGKWLPTGFISRKLKGAEMNYAVTEKECLAVVFALKNFRHYLHGGPEFEVITDHHALKWLLSLKEPKGKLAMWMMEIQNFSFKAEYAPGNQLVVPDALSRDSIPFPLCSKSRRI